MTNIEAALAALEKLPETMTESCLIVGLWQADKDRFGLPSFREYYPDSHKVLTMLCGQRGLVARGHLRRIGNGMYQNLVPGRPKECRAYPPKPVAFTTNGLDSPSRHVNPEPGKALNPALDESGPNKEEMELWLRGDRVAAVNKMRTRTGKKTTECLDAFRPSPLTRGIG